jgi:hypothetical protein
LALVAFKVSALVSLHWGQKMLSSFLGVLPILISLLCALAFILWSKFNPLVVFALDLMSAYKGEHTIFGLLGQANLTQNDVLQFQLDNKLKQICKC